MLGLGLILEKTLEIDSGRTQGEAAMYKTESLPETKHAGTLILNFKPLAL